MKIFVSYRFRGENKKDLKSKLEKITSILENNGHQSFVYFRDKENWKTKCLPPGKAIKEAFKEIKKCDAVLGFLDQKEMSEGMLLEFGFAKALNKKLILLISSKYSRPTLEALSDKAVKFKQLKNLEKNLGKYLNFRNL